MTTTLSARSSFTNHDALLFYAAGLDPNVTHTIDIVNGQDGAVLALNRDGFSVMTVTYVDFSCSGCVLFERFPGRPLPLAFPRAMPAQDHGLKGRSPPSLSEVSWAF